MSVYTDGVHVVADTLDELHSFARKMNFPRSWFQNKKREHPHYDLTTRRAELRAILHGAIRVDSKEVVSIMRRMDGKAGE